MACEWVESKRWSDQFIPEIKTILGVHLIGEAPIEEDQERNTDLVVLRMDPVRIACRVRNHSYLDRYRNQFTIREGRPSGVKTELTKFIEGWGDFFFYGFAGENGQALARWMLIELKAFRLWFFRQIVSMSGRLPGKACNNSDGSSWFRAFNLYDLEPDAILAEYPRLDF